MERQELGRSGLKVAPWALGTNVLGWNVDDATGFKLLDAFVDAGFNLVDSADVYSRWIPGHVGGESEALIGRWIAQGGGRREKVVIATKLGMDMPDGKGLSPAYMKVAVEKSLQRLQTDVIDLYQSHRDDPETPQEETLAAYAELIKAGKVRAIGASNFTAPRLAEALKLAADKGLPRYETLQPHYNLYDRHEFEAELAGLCKREGLGVIPYFGLASGFLTGKYRTEKDLEGSARAYAAKNMLNPRGLRILEAMDKVGARIGATDAQIAPGLAARQGLHPDRQRHQPRPAQGPRQVGGGHAGRRGRGRARRRQRTRRRRRGRPPRPAPAATGEDRGGVEHCCHPGRPQGRSGTHPAASEDGPRLSRPPSRASGRDDVWVGRREAGAGLSRRPSTSPSRRACRPGGLPRTGSGRRGLARRGWPPGPRRRSRAARL
ncbi:MAG: aldo/keto reductase [Caulobacteraceae bacterium]